MTRPRESTDQAREYIDQIVAISRRHGMGSTISDESYEQAVDEVARAFKHLTPKQSN